MALNDTAHIWRRRMIILLGMAGLGCIVGPLGLLALRPEPIRSHRDAIGFVLRQHGVAYSEISLAQPWPAAFNYYAYGSAIYPYTLDVRVVRPDAAPLSGSFLCRNGQRDCVITLRDVGIITVAAPDPFDQRLHPWIDAVFEQIDRMLTTMRR